jgi:glycosyltransferase involved in cell wall biosynthesis
VVRDGETGLIIEPDGPALAAAIRRYATDAGLRESHGRAARQAAALYTLDRQVDAFLSLYADLTS